MRKILCYLLFAVLLFVVTAMWYAWRWQSLFVPAKPRPAYSVYGHGADTILIAMIGDSWAGLHSSSRQDSTISSEWTAFLGRSVRFVSCGKGGANSGDVYRLMFYQHLPIDSFSSMHLLQQRPDFCLISAGINDASQNIGVKTYCANYHLILQHLLRCGIRPIVLEIPDVDLKRVYGDKSLKDRLAETYKDFLAGTERYNVAEYRQALYQYMSDNGLLDSVIYVNRIMWNPKGYRDTAIYLPDCIHLNELGYARLDSCVISIIQSELQ